MSFRGDLGNHMSQLAYFLSLGKKYQNLQLSTHPSFMESYSLDEMSSSYFIKNLFLPNVNIDFSLTPSQIGKLYCVADTPYSPFTIAPLVIQQETILLTGDYQALGNFDQDLILPLFCKPLPPIQPTQTVIDLSWHNVPNTPGVKASLLEYWDRSLRWESMTSMEQRIRESSVIYSSESYAVDWFVDTYHADVKKLSAVECLVSLREASSRSIGGNAMHAWWAYFLQDSTPRKFFILPSRWDLAAAQDYWSPGLFPKEKTLTIL